MREFKSIRFKIVFWHTLLLTAVLCAFSSFVYLLFRKELLADIDDMLQLKASGIADSINTYWEMEKVEGLRLGARAEAFSKIDNLNFIRIARRWVMERGDDPKSAGIIVDVIDSYGKVIATSRGRSDEGRNARVRSFLRPVLENGTVAYVVQVSCSLDTVEDSLGKLRFIFLIILPLAAVCSAVAGTALARLIIGPVKRIIAGMHAVTADNLKHRIEVPDTRDEIRELVDNFNLMLEKLDASFSMQRQLVQDISHELRTPLTILKGEMELALKRPRPAEEYRATLHSGLEEIERIGRIVENMLVLCRFDSHQVQLDIVPVEVDGLLQGIVDDVRVLTQRKGLSVTFTPAGGLVQADPAQLRRAFLNLVDNAIKYTCAGGTVDISSRVAAEGVIVTVADTGIGIPEKDLPHIFDRFYRVDQSRSSDGFGLGLSIVQSIIAAHHGTVSVCSSPGRGSAFTVSLPIKIN